MKITRKILTICLCLALGSLFVACGAELNPKTQANIQNALEAKKGEFQKCYESALERDREITGDMNLGLEFRGTEKKPKEVKVKKTEIKDVGMIGCVTKAAKGIKLKEVPNVPVESTNKVKFQFE